MIKSTKIFLASLTLVALAACSGSNGGASHSGGGNGSGGVPDSQSIADLTAFATEGSTSVNARGVTVQRNAYADGSGRTDVQLAGSEQVGLLSVTREGQPVQSHTLIGADENSSVNHRGYYVAETSGALRMRAGDATAAVTGDTAIGLDASTGEWQLGSTVFDDTGESGAYIGIDGGTVRGNTMVFDASKSKMSEITPDGVLSSAEQAGATAVFGRGGETVFGKVTGQNAETGFGVDLGFAGTDFKD